MPGAQLPASSMMPSPRISPARTTRLVVVIVSQATRASGSFDRNRSTIASLIWSATLSGWPSETDSDVKRYELRMGLLGSSIVRPAWPEPQIKNASCVAPIAPRPPEGNGRDDEREAEQQRNDVAEAGEECRCSGGRKLGVDDTGLAPRQLLHDLTVRIDDCTDS